MSALTGLAAINADVGQTQVDTSDLGLPPTTTVEAEPAPQPEPRGLSADELAAHGWEEPASSQSLEDRLLNTEGDAQPPPVQTESAEVTEASPGSGSANVPTPAPQLDSNQQFQMATLQMFQQMQQQNQAFQQQILETIRPKEKPVEVDPLADMPKEWKAIEGLPEFLKYTIQKNKAEVDALKTSLDERINAATQRREADRYASEAKAVGQKILSQGFHFQSEQDQAAVSDALHDMALSLANVHGGSPAKYEQALHRVINTAVQARQAHLNSQAKASVAQRHAPKPTQSAPAIPQSQTPMKEPTLAQVRSAGYRDMDEARWDDFRRVHSRQARN